MENNDKNLYELGYLLIPIIPVEKLSDEANSLKSYIEAKGGLVVGEEQPKMKKLSYEILHRVAGGKNVRYDDAHFGWIRFNLSPSSVKDLETEIKKNTSILRYLVINITNEMGSDKKDAGKASSVKKPKKPISEDSEKEIDKEIDNLLEKSEVEIKA